MRCIHTVCILCFPRTASSWPWFHRLPFTPARPAHAVRCDVYLNQPRSLSPLDCCIKVFSVNFMLFPCEGCTSAVEIAMFAMRIMASWDRTLAKSPYRSSHPLSRDPQSKPGAKSRSPVLAVSPERLMLQLGRYSGDGG